jgi:hypothetical protein
MLIVADTHVHVYRDYDMAAALRHGLQNLSRLAAAAAGDGEAVDSDGALMAMFLTEADSSRFFSDLRDGRLADRLPGWTVESAGGGGALWIAPDAVSPTTAPTSTATGRLLIVAGRQIVTEERLEVLALATDRQTGGLAGRPSAKDAIETVRSAGGVPVLSWAPGKWAFGRGQVVASLIEAAEPGTLLVGDTSLRASASEPQLIQRAHARGLKVVAGSDPLPIGGEEQILGSYGVSWTAEVDPARPLHSLRRTLLDPAVPTTTVGTRSTFAGVVSRLARHTLASKLGRSHG